MNSRERLLTAIRLEEADRVPCSPHVVPEMVPKMTKDQWEALLHFTDVTMTVGALGAIEIFGGQQLMDRSTVTQEGNTLTDEIETPQGVLRAIRVITEQTTWRAERLFKGREDIDKILSIPYVAPQFDVEDYVAWTERVGDEGFLSLGIPTAFKFCLYCYGPQMLYLMMADEPDLIEKLVATMNERLEVYVEACCSKGVRSFWMGGSEHCGPGVVNPKLFRRMIAPYDKRIVNIIHECDGIVNYHTHGKLTDILDDIAEIGVDVMSPIESGIRGDVTLAEVKGRIGDRVCLKGNLDDMAFLLFASEEAVRTAAEDCLGQAAKGGGYILSGTDAAIYRPEWVKSFLVMAQVASDHPYR